MDQGIIGIFESSDEFDEFTKEHFIVSMQKIVKKMHNFTPMSVSLTPDVLS